jgi:tetratricopeptide (TPR) repeat protein
MRKTPWAAYLWPGLPALWIDGAWSGLALALSAAALLDVLLLSTLVWVEWFPAATVKLGWCLATGFWIGAAVLAVKERSKSGVDQQQSLEGLFRRAQAEYLQGDYFQAEATLAELLEANPRDAEGRLLLATLLRHTKRYPEAEDQLKQLTRFETAARWQIEINSERARIKKLRKAAKTQPVPRVDKPSEDLTDPIQLPEAAPPDQARAA